MTTDEWNEEWRGAVDTMTETERYTSCDHRRRNHRLTCHHCGDQEEA